MRGRVEVHRTHEFRGLSNFVVPTVGPFTVPPRYSHLILHSITSPSVATENEHFKSFKYHYVHRWFNESHLRLCVRPTHQTAIVIRWKSCETLALEVYNLGKLFTVIARTSTWTV